MTDVNEGPDEEIEKRLTAARFLRAKLRYLATQIAMGSVTSWEAFRRKLGDPAAPLNLVEGDRLEIAIDGDPEDLSHLRFALDSFWQDLRRFLEFVTRAIVLSCGGDDTDFSYSKFLNHVCSPRPGNNPPIWLGPCSEVRPAFLRHVREAEPWLRKLSTIRTYLVHFEIRIDVKGQSSAAWIVGASTAIRRSKDWDTLDRPVAHITIDNEPIERVVNECLSRIDSYLASTQ